MIDIDNPGVWIALAAVLAICGVGAVLALIELKERDKKYPLPLIHFINRHDNCPPQRCQKAAAMCNAIEAEIRMAEYKSRFDCPNCGETKTFPVPETGYDRYCTVCHCVFVPYGYQDWWDG